MQNISPGLPAVSGLARNDSLFRPLAAPLGQALLGTAAAQRESELTEAKWLRMPQPSRQDFALKSPGNKALRCMHGASEMWVMTRPHGLGYNMPPFQG